MVKFEQTLKPYLDDISHNEVLTREEEVELFKRYEKGDEHARREIIEANLRFVVKIAVSFMGKGLSLPDLVQEGNIGLLAVIDKYDWRKGYRFSTYAAFWIRQTIQLAVRRQNSLVKLPLRKARLMGKITEYINTYRVRHGKDASEKEIADGLNVDPEQLKSIMTWRDSILSLDSHPGESTDCTLYDFVTDSESMNPHEICLEHERQEKVEQMLSTLTEREKNVVKLRFGFDGNEPLSLRQASKKIGLSQEGVRKIEKRALEKLRRPATRAQLTGLL